MNHSVYSKRLGLFRNPAVRRELQRLNPEKDYQRMVQLLVGYEFPFDITRALELALFHTYASPRVSALLARTGEFERRGQKRYDDTSLLIAWFMQEGPDSDLGSQAIRHMNRIHGAYRIANEDYLFVLSTFVFYPVNWLNRYGWRQLTAGEEKAFFLFFREVGKRMGLKDVPDSSEALQSFADAYEKEHFRYTESNRMVADATVRVVENWLPKPLRPAVKPVVSAMISESLREAFGYKPAPGWLSVTIDNALRLRRLPLRYITLKPYPVLIQNSHYTSYPAGVPSMQELGPEQVIKRARETSDRKEADSG